MSPIENEPERTRSLIRPGVWAVELREKDKLPDPEFAKKVAAESGLESFSVNILRAADRDVVEAEVKDKKKRA